MVAARPRGRGLLSGAVFLFCAVTLLPAAVTVRVGVEGTGPPFSYRDAHGALTGYVIEQVNTIARRRHWQVEWVEKPWTELMADFRAGRIDVLGHVGYSTARAEWVDFSATAVLMDAGIFVHKGADSLHTLADLRGKRVCALVNSIAWDYLQAQRDWDLVLVPAHSRQELIQHLAERRADAAVMMAAVMDHLIRTTEFGERIQRSRLALPTPIYDMRLGVRPDRPDLLADVNEGLMSLIRAGEDHLLYERWISPMQSRPLTWRQSRPFFLGMGALTILLLGVGVFFLWQRRRLQITAAQSAELREREKQLRTITDAVPALIGYIDPQHRYVRVNHGYERFFKRPASDILGRTITELLPPEAAALATAGIDRALAGEHVSEHHHITLPSGERRLLQANVTPDYGPDGVIAGCTHIGFDLTDQARAEQGLALQGAALQAAVCAIVITDPAGRIHWANQAHETLTGYPLETARGRGLCELVQADRHDAVFYATLWQTVRAGRVWRGECQHRRRDGQPFTEEMSVTPLRDADGHHTHCIAIRQDITERQRLEARYLHSQRQESLGQLASGIAHDLNNILTPVLLAPAMLREHLRDPQAHKLIEIIESNARRGTDLLKQLRTYGHGAEVRKESVQLATVVESLQRTLRETLPATIRLEVRPLPPLPAVHGDATQLHQILLNLCVNARDAMPSGGVLTLALAEQTLDAAMVAAMPEGRTGGFLALSVTDTGTGVPPEHQQRIFEPFFTTKAPGEGTGLGLSTVVGLVRSHGGFINLESELGRGSCFTVYLPVSTDAPDAPAQQPSATVEPAGRGRRILLVDDEAFVVQTLRFMLERQGYRTQLAANGLEAMKLFHGATEPFDAVITDLMMPGMDGKTLVRTLRQVDPRIRILVVSGHATVRAVAADLAGLVDGVVAKPFTAEELLGQLQRSFAAPARGEERQAT